MWSASLVESLSAGWLFGQSHGEALSDIGPALVEGVLAGAVWQPGREGSHALTFDGGTAHAMVADHAALKWSTGFSVSFWLKQLSLVGNHGYVIQKGAVGTGFWGVNPMESTPSFYLSRVGLGFYVVPFTRPRLGEWDHYCFTHDADYGAKVYYNGWLEQSVSAPGLVENNTGALCVGSYQGSVSYSLHGMLQHVALFRRAVTADEAWELYANPTGLVAEAVMPVVESSEGGRPPSWWTREPLFAGRLQ